MEAQESEWNNEIKGTREGGREEGMEIGRERWREGGMDKRKDGEREE